MKACSVGKETKRYPFAPQRLRGPKRPEKKGGNPRDVVASKRNRLQMNQRRGGKG